MKTSNFFFDLPEELIAQSPLENRDNSRLLVLDRKSGEIEHKKFNDILEYIDEGDCLVLNDTKVLPARIFGKKSTGATVEFLLLEKTSEENIWKCLVKPGKKAKPGSIFTFGDNLFAGEVIKIGDGGVRHVLFKFEGIFENLLDEIGQMPLPPYIKEKLENKDRYQTVYAKNYGSAAAPTAGLHFTGELLKKIKDKNIEIAYVTLHVGIGTFRPVKTENILEHKMHSEFYTLDKINAKKINAVKNKGGKIISVGTTTTRTLEYIMKNDGYISESSGWTDIFIYPGYNFEIVDVLITNFHLPESTLIMLVSAFANRKIVLNAYKEAVNERYRFFSFGDAMLIV